jgi:hypothetical protein
VKRLRFRLIRNDGWEKSTLVVGIEVPALFGIWFKADSSNMATHALEFLRHRASRSHIHQQDRISLQKFIRLSPSPLPVPVIGQLGIHGANGRNQSPP